MDTSKNPETPIDQPINEMSATPPDQATVTPSEPKAPIHRRLSKKVVLLMAVLVLFICGGAYAFYSHSQKKTPVASTTSAKQEQTKNTTEAPISYASILVFQQSSTASTSTTSLVNLDGTVKSTFNSNASSSSYDASGFSQENLALLEGSSLITVDKNWSSFAVLTPDGKATPVSSSLSTLLAGNAHPNSANTLSSGITAGKTTLFALESSTGSTAIKFVKIDLASGTNTTLLSADAIKQERPGYTPLQLITLSKDGKTAYLITNDAKVDTTTTSGISLVICDTATGKFTFKKLPSEIDPLSASVSKDGKWVAYTASGSNNGYGTVTTHIYNVETGKDNAVTEEGLLTSGGGTDIRFSPDGAYVSEVGHYAADAKKAGMALQVISTSSNKVVKQVDLVGVQYQVTGFDWTSDSSFIYATNSSSTGNYDVMKEAVHSVDASTGKIFDFPNNSGELVAVLNYQQ